MTTNDTPSHLLKPRFFSTTKDERTDSAINLGSVDVSREGWIAGILQNAEPAFFKTNLSSSQLDDFNKHNLSNSSSSSSLSSSSSSHRAHRLNPRYWPSRPSSLSNYSRPISPTNNIECPSTTTTTKVPSFSSHTIHQPHHISRSLPTSRRNSTDLTSLWSSLDSLNLNPRPAGDIRRKE